MRQYQTRSQSALAACFGMPRLRLHGAHRRPEQRRLGELEDPARGGEGQQDALPGFGVIEAGRAEDDAGEEEPGAQYRAHEERPEGPVLPAQGAEAAEHHEVACGGQDIVEVKEI